ncbi:MAG: hypothetical protein ABIG34_02475 [Candidatus Peregrinibacteria bacterium]
MATVYVIDMIMVSKTYTKPSQPMLIGSAFSILSGLILMMLLDWDNPPPTSACYMALGAGVLFMMTCWLCCLVVFSGAGECVEVACFDCSSVFIVALAIFIMHCLHVPLHDTILFRQWLGVIIGGCGLIAVHVFGDKMAFVDWRYRLLLIGLMLCGAAYELLIDRAIFVAIVPLQGMPNPDLSAFLQVSPFFWFGLSTGCVAILPRSERQAWKENFPNIRRDFWLVVLVQVLSILGFSSAIFAFAKGHVAIVSLLTGSSPVFVLIVSVGLRRYFGFDQNTFPEIQHPMKKTLAILLVIAGSTLASWN